ncbi:hypothetical protein RCL1_004098 [Eukaryota sp. TZLM3-RCL]
MTDIKEQPLWEKIAGWILVISFAGGIILYLVLHGSPFGHIDYSTSLLPQSTYVLRDYDARHASRVSFFNLYGGKGYLCPNVPPLTHNVVTPSVHFHYVPTRNGRVFGLNLNQGSKVKLEIDAMDPILWFLRGYTNLRKARNNNKNLNWERRPSFVDNFPIFDTDQFYLFFNSTGNTHSADGYIDLEMPIHDLSNCQEVCDYGKTPRCSIKLAKDSQEVVVLEGAQKDYWPQFKLSASRLLTPRRTLELIALVGFWGSILGCAVLIPRHFIEQAGKSYADRQAKRAGIETDVVYFNPNEELPVTTVNPMMTMV